MKKKKHTSIYYYTPAICWGILICYFSLMPGPDLPSLLVSIKDFILHFGIYLGLGLLLWLGANQFTTQPVPYTTVALLFFTAFFMGLAIEFIQENYIEGRLFEWSDVMFNSMGIAFMWIANAVSQKKSASKNS